MRRVSKSGALGLLMLAAGAIATACEESREPSQVFVPGVGGTAAQLPPGLGGSLIIVPGAGSSGLDNVSPCAQAVPPAPLTRWSVLDLDGTLDDLFGPGTTLASTIKVGDRRYWRDLSVGFVEALRSVARERVQSAVAESDTFEVCGSDDVGDSCIQPWLSDWGEKLYRRPLSPEQLEAYVTQFQSAQARMTPAEAAKNALISMLLSPYFALRLELGNPSTGQLDSYEVAARLSHFATRRAPDAELRRSAASDAILEPAERLAQLRRLWQLPAGRAARVQQHLDWLELSESALPQELGAELRAELLEQSARFIDDVFETQGATLTALLTSARLPLTPVLAEHYGLPAPETDGFSFVQGEPTLASGLLSQGLFLSAFPSPTLRGLAIYRGLLCGSLPDHPATVVAELADGATPRERITQGIAGRTECRTCHDVIDPLGFGFEAFDEQGRPSGFESHAAVRANSVNLTFEANNPAELGRGVAQSPAAAWCAARHYLERALDRELTPAISPSVGTISQGPPPIPIKREEPDKDWTACIVQRGWAGGFNLQAGMEALVQSVVFTARASGSRHVVALDTSVNPLDHAAQEASQFVGAFFDPSDNETVRAYGNVLSELKRLDELGPGQGGAGGGGGAGGADGGGTSGQNSAGGNGAAGAP